DHHLPALSDRLPEPFDDATGDGKRIANRPVAELEHVTQQYEPIDFTDRREQGCAGHVVAEHVALGTRTEVQVGDDERAQRPTRRPWPPAARAPGGSPSGA